MKFNLYISVLSLTFLLIIFDACTDKLPVPALDCSTTSVGYDNHIKGILNSTCNTSGCHDDVVMSSFGDYSTLSDPRKESIAIRVENGEMPPSGAISAAAVDSIRCWRESGYPQ